MTHYKMIDAATLSNFRRFMASGIPLTEFGPQGAFDSKPRRAKDEEGEGAAHGLAAMLLALREKLGDEGFKELCAKVCGEEPEEAEAAEDTDPAAEFASPMEREMADAKDKKAKDKKAKDARKAKDEPEPFRGEPETKAMDAASDKRFDYLTDMQRVKPDNGSAFTDRSSQTRRAPSTASAERSFEAMYGQHAVDIKGAR